MARVICLRPNASELINGVVFEAHGQAMISEEISDEQARQFTRISGYRLLAQNAAPGSESTADGNIADVDDLEALREQVRALGIKLNMRWRHDRLRAEIEKAQTT